MVRRPAPAPGAAPAAPPAGAGSAAAMWSRALDAPRWAQLGFEVWSGGWAGAAQRRRRAEQRLQQIVRAARRDVPLYRARYAAVPNRGPVELARLEPLSKRELMARFDEAVADPAVTAAAVRDFTADPARAGTRFLDRYAVWSSSGSSGLPGYFVHDTDALAVYEALELFRFRGLATPLDFALRLAAGERYAMVAATGGHFAGIATVEHLRRVYPWLAGSLRAVSLMQPLPALVAELNAWRPTLLATYPTAAEVLADEQAAGRLRLALTELWTGGECLHEPVRARLARVFGAVVRNGYGASEFPSIAGSCAHGRLHVNDDWVLLEPIDAHGAAVAPGSVSHSVLLTNLANRVQPLIRYDLGDAIHVLPDACPCGSDLPAIAVQGRHDDILHFARRGAPAVRLVPLAIATVLEEDAGVHDFQLVQTGPRGLSLWLGGADRAAAARACAVLGAHLRAQGVERVHIAVRDGAPERSPASGKLRRVIYAAG